MRSGKARGRDVSFAKFEHLAGQVDRRDLAIRMPAAKLDGNLGRARAHVQDLFDARTVPAVHGFQKLLGEPAVDFGMVHRIVIRRFPGGVHDFRL